MTPRATVKSSEARRNKSSTGIRGKLCLWMYSALGLQTACYQNLNKKESRALARKPRDAAVAVLFGLKFADNIHYIEV